ncbi:MAG: indolepyruvate ferredoxin oxidoreductase family protein [Rhizobiaceae bacterium]|nr:indolepyruvate ferredoxin oxidoreductase family protein [Rhizobiaceae bacterium]
MGETNPTVNLLSKSITLEDKYTATEGKVFMNGTQALVRLPLVQMRRDRAAGLNTGAFISGYRGSPIGAYDFALTQAKKHLDKEGVVFQPGVNEDLAATAVWGSQQLDTTPGANKDGVVGFWYGKGPGVDRSGDVFKHATSAGTHKNGGVLAFAGDDHTAKSSTVAHQSDHAFMAAIMPMLFPTSVHEFVELGLLGIAMSRYSGAWVGYKVISDTIETTGVVDLAGEHRQFVLPTDYEMPEGGLNLRWPDGILDQDERLQEHKGYAALAFARANNIDQMIYDSKKPRFGIVASGKAFENVREALRQLGIDEKTADDIGLRLYKVRMPWPLEPEGIRKFSEGLEEVLVIEERREIIEHQIKQQLFNWRADVRPRIVGKFDHEDNHILKLNEEMTAGVAVRAISNRLLTFDLPGGLANRIKQKLAYYEERAGIRKKHEAPVTRTAHFCSGCPHNTSTKVPDGSRAMAGIGCHFMSVWMGRNTETFSHMGGEGISWTGLSHFTDEKHVFANLGDGTYFHSGYMAIRQAVASGANITYKILFNDAVAMTGGQNHDGPLDPPTISKQLKAEGVKEIYLVSDEPQRYFKSEFAQGVEIRHRDHIEEVQKHLRTVKGCTAIIYDQTCAAELRRRRKRGLAKDPDKRAFINPLVCEGCGDCSVQSNCISIEPLETEWGRKRKINQSSCNKDFSCVEGFCPSFVTIEGGQLKKPALPELDATDLPSPEVRPLDDIYNVAITGVGGTGVLTIGAILGMAAHLEGKAALMLDVAGLAQKGGAVLSHVRLAKDPKLVTAPQIVTGEADLLLAADTVVAAAQSSIALFSPENTHAVLNTHLSPVSNFIFDRDFDFREVGVVDTIKEHVKSETDQVDFTKLAETVCGDAIATNIMMVGYAAQAGLLPISPEAIERAIELNAVAVKANKLAFAWGRKFAAEPDEASRLLKESQSVAEEPDTLEEIINKRTAFLTEYQDADYAKTYRDFVSKVETAEDALGKKRDLTNAVARNLFKLMSYKDEYEVARLFTNGEFEKQIADTFEGSFTMKHHLAPPILGFGKKPNGRPRKRAFGPWMMKAFKQLAKLKGLRGGTFDIFGYTKERKMERQLIKDYKSMISEVLPKLTEENRPFANALARLPNEIRGFGPVKEASVKKVEDSKADLMTQFLKPANAKGKTTKKSAEPAE